MSESRLNQKSKITLPDTGAKLDRIFTYTLASMADAARCYREAWTHKPRTKKSIEQRPVCLSVIPPAMLSGEPASLPGILEIADTLADAAVAIDPRLGARPGWVRAAEGVDLDAALLAAGEENCCFARKRRRRSEKAPGGEPVRIVISTDSKIVTPAAASSFIAAARLAAQFVPLEIWWQGSWLKEEGPSKGKGHIFHVPLVSAGEMDFARLQFVLCSEFRDHASYMIMFRHAFPAGLGWGGGQMPYSTLPRTRDFVEASGILATPEAIAERAARWIGLESAWAVKYEANRSTAQEWRPADGTETVYTPYEPTAEDRARWAADEREREEEAARAARARADEAF